MSWTLADEEAYCDQLADSAGRSLLDVADAWDLYDRWPRLTTIRLFREALERHYRAVEHANARERRLESMREARGA